MKPKALDVCAGAGGLSLGLTRAGFDVLGIEIDPDAVDTHRRHAGPCEIADVRTYHPTDRFVLVAGGVPCQPFSTAGARLGLDDPRYMVPELLRIAREAGAEVVMLENVRGLVHDVRAFRVVLDAFEAEYSTTWRVLDAADYGVPQHRDRVLVVGFRDRSAAARYRWPLATHSPPGSLFGDPYRSVREALGLDGKPYRTGTKDGTKPGSTGGMRFLDVDTPAYTISGTCFDRLSALDQPAPCITATEHKSAMNGTQPMHRRRRASERLSDALEAAGLADRPATTVQGDPRLAVAGHHDRQQNGAVRLTPAQCAVLQDFPPGWTFTGNKSSQHKQIGNAVPPGLAEAVGRAIMAALGGAR